MYSTEAEVKWRLVKYKKTTEQQQLGPKTDGKYCNQHLFLSVCLFAHVSQKSHV